MPDQPKLTKKQRKGLAFRQRKGTGKGDKNERNGAGDEPRGGDVPVSEVPLDEDEDGEGQDRADGHERGQLPDKLGRKANDNVTNGSAGTSASAASTGARKVKEDRKTKSSTSGDAGDSAEGSSPVQLNSRKRKRGAGGDVGSDNEEAQSKRENLKEKKGKKRTGGTEDTNQGNRSWEKDQGNEDEGENDETGQGTDSEIDVNSEKTKQKSRFILFVGNLKYTTTKEAVAQHFSSCDPPPQIRLLTPKPKSSTGANTNAIARSKSKGCAFLEFSHRNALQQGLKLHQSELDGRMINVELTAGGGGKSETRLQKLKERNKGLAFQRTKRIQKEHKSSGKGVTSGEESQIERPQRHSTTSGMDQVPLKKRTWTIADEGDDETHRGGKKHAKGDKKRGVKRKRELGTGVNAIPIG